MKFIIILMMLEVFTFIKAASDICDYIGLCEEGFLWDFTSCGCIPAASCSRPADGCPGSEWDSVNCECYPIAVCSIAYGCAEAPSNPPCTCLRCIDELCPGGSSRMLENNCQCSQIACSSEPCPGLLERDPATCECPMLYCDPNWEVCNPDKGWRWYGNPDCVCKCEADRVPCPDGSSRDPETCECPPELICDPPPNSFVEKKWKPYPDCSFECDPELPSCDDGSPRSLEYDCQCPQIVCDPAPGCGNWLGWPTCKCTACTEDLCFDGSSRLLDNFCGCPECPKPDTCLGEWDNFNCECSTPICTQDLCWDGNPRDPLTCECNPQVVCDPGPGCGNWLGYPECQCTACTEDLCSDGSARSLKSQCQCPCSKPDNCIGEWDKFNCRCIPRVCDPEWPPPYPANQWLPYPSCKWSCVPEECPGRKVWNTEECKCKRPLKCRPE